MRIADEIISYLGYSDEDEAHLVHYGMPRRSGRYPWGSGDQPYQHSGDLLSRYEELKGKGLSETEVARAMGFVDSRTNQTQTTKLRAQLSLAKAERRQDLVETARRLRDKEGLSLAQIAKKMGFKNDSSVRALLDEEAEARMKAATKTADFLKKQIDEKGMIDVGKGVENELGISREKLNQALYILEMQGYPTYKGGVPQVTNPGKQTNIQVVCPPNTKWKEIYDYGKINSIRDYASIDDGETFSKFQYPSSLNSKRLQVKYAEEGGIKKDGVIEIRRGVKDLDLGNSNYAQVRILVDGTHYLKGMAMYSDDLPKGVDVMFNTNKKKGTPLEKVLKPIKDNPENPFGSMIKRNGQSEYIDKDGKKKLSLINKTREEGDWDKYSNKLSSQFIGKQSLELIKKQLKLTLAERQEEYDDIKSLTNPAIKKSFLNSFANDCDAAAVHLKCAALPRQKTKVLLPITTLKDNEVYAPTFRNGEKIALVRFPHGGTFEIPVLTVNNKHKDAKRILGDALDAIGINAHVAERLSGADFDGDTALCIPTAGNGRNSKIKITSTKQLKGLEGFDPKSEYPKVEGMKKMKNTQTEMGKISNLITDMTIKGATEDELARAVRHSMVVIDAEKHELNYKKSEQKENIAALKKKYQGTIDPETGRMKTGAGTLLSRSKSQVSVRKTKGSPTIDPETGKLKYKLDESTYVDSKGNTVHRMVKSTRMAETDDAFTLTSGPMGTSGTKVEEAYALYANQLKSYANNARKEILATKKIPYSPTAHKQYATEVKSLQDKLNIALSNAPRERRAQTIANSKINAIKQEYDNLSKEDLKKIKQQELTKARTQVGAKRETIEITDKEWTAIQSGAISETKLTQIVNHCDIDKLRERAMPRAKTTLSNGKIARIKAMRESGYTLAEIADAVGVSTSSIANYLR